MGDKLKDPTADILVRSAHDRFQTLRNRLGISNKNMERRINTRGTDKSISLGDKCYVKLSVRNELNYKLGPRFEGPFEIIEQLVGNKYRVRSVGDNKEKIVHISQIKMSTVKQKKKVRFLV